MGKDVKSRVLSKQIPLTLMERNYLLMSLLPQGKEEKHAWDYMFKRDALMSLLRYAETDQWTDQVQIDEARIRLAYETSVRSGASMEDLPPRALSLEQVQGSEETFSLPVSLWKMAVERMKLMNWGNFRPSIVVSLCQAMGITPEPEDQVPENTEITPEPEDQIPENTEVVTSP